MIRAAIAVALACAHSTSGQAIVFDLSDVPAGGLLFGETATIRAYASFPPDLYAVAGIETALLTSEGSEGLGGFSILPPFDAGPAPIVTDDGIEGILAGQINFPAAGIFADPTNPVAVFEFGYSVTRTDEFDLELFTRTDRFDAYVDRGSTDTIDLLGNLTEASAIIPINVPAPGVLAVLGLLSLGRRHR
ncbi:MAG: hypothetical protein AAFX79_06440 [Planctomycetota bacterium]